MPEFQRSGSFRIVCSGCQRNNELTALNLLGGETVTCSHCQASLGAWEALAAEGARADSPETELPG